ncbi:MAG: hyaluronate lyase [Bacillota bacterium]
MSTRPQNTPSQETGAADTPRLPPRRRGLIWLGTNTCDGHIISFLNTYRPSIRDILEQEFTLYYCSFLLAAEGRRAMALMTLPERLREDFILVVEGTVPTAFGGRTAVVGKTHGRNLTALEAVKWLGARARHVVAAGTCAAYGGPYAAWPNPTGSLPVSAVLDRTVIKVPCCPVNPGWILETLRRLRRDDAVAVDGAGRPLFLYDATVHSLCERLPFFERAQFARGPGEPGCMYLVGCKGPVTRADCPRRRWNDQQSGWPVGTDSPCIGCTAPEFPDEVSPSFRHQTDIYTRLARVNLDQLGIGVGCFTLLAIGAHLALRILTGRIKIPALQKLAKTVASAVARRFS